MEKAGRNWMCWMDFKRYRRRKIQNHIWNEDKIIGYPRKDKCKVKLNKQYYKQTREWKWDKENKKNVREKVVEMEKKERKHHKKY